MTRDRSSVSSVLKHDYWDTNLQMVKAATFQIVNYQLLILFYTIKYFQVTQRGYTTELFKIDIFCSM
jgi:hypothetical protein